MHVFWYFVADYGLVGRRENKRPKKYTSDYLVALVKEKSELQSLPRIFTHIERLIDDGWSFMSSIYKVHEYRLITKQRSARCRARLAP